MGYIYDPDDGLLIGWRGGDGGLEEITEMNGHVSQRLGVRFEPGEGPNNLRIIEPERPTVPHPSGVNGASRGRTPTR